MVFCSAQLTHNADIWSAPKMLLLRITAQGGQKKKTKASPSSYVTQYLSESLQQATLEIIFTKIQSSKHIFSNQILARQVFSFTSFIFISVVTREDSRVAKILQPLTGFHVIL